MKKKLTSLIALLTLCISGASAQVVTTWDSGFTSNLVSKDALVASVGTGARYAFRMPSSSKPGWCDFVNEASSSANALTTGALFSIETGSAAGTYWLKRYDGQYLSGNGTFGSAGIDLTLTDRAPSGVSDYDTGFSNSSSYVSFDNSAGLHYNCGNASGGLQFRGGTGGWSVYAAVGPLYVVTVKFVDTDNASIQSDATYFVKANTELTAPTVSGYTVQGTSSYTITTDQTVTFTYNALPAFDPNDVAGKTFTLQCARGYVYYNGTQLAGTSTASNASKFAIVSYDSNTYLYDVTNNAFVCHTTAATAGTTGNAALESSDDFSKAVKGLTFGSTGIDAYPYYLDESQYTNRLNMDGSPLVYFNRWLDFEGGAGGNTYKIAVVDVDFDETDAVAMLDAYFNPSATVTYVITDGSGVIYTSEAIAATVSETITTLPSDLQRPYCTYSVTSTTIVAGNNNVPVTVTYNPPFTVSSDFATATWYYATLRGKYLRADESHKDGSGRYQTNTTNEKTDVYKWAFVGNPYELSIINKGAGNSKVLYAGDVPVMQAATPASDNKARWIVSSNSNGGFSVRSESGATMYLNDASSAGNLGYWNSSWGANDVGSNWVVEEVSPVCEVTYTYTYGGNTYTSTELQNIGDPVALPADIKYAYTNYTFDTTNVPDAATATVNVTVTSFSMPFTTSTDYSTATWYFLRGHASTNYYPSHYISTNETSIVWADGKSYADAYMWAFIGNPIEGIQLINKASGEGYYLTDTETATSMTTTATNWVLKENDATKFGLWSTTRNQYANAAGGTIKYYGQFDNGSLFWVEIIPAEAAQFDDAIAQLEAYPYGTGLNQYSLVVEGNDYTSQATTIISELKTAGYTTENLANAQLMLAGTSINLPATGKFYRIKGYSCNYITSNAAGSNGAMNGTANANNIVYYSAEQNLIFFGSGYGLYNTSIIAPTGSTLNAYTFMQGAQLCHYYVKSNYAGGGQYCYDNTANGTKLDRNGSPVTSGSYQTDWTLEEVTTLPVTISSVGYATLYAPVALTIPTGVTAYKAEDKGETLSLTAIEGGVIPAEEGVILEGAGSYDFAITTTETTISDNALTGTVVAIARPTGSYILSTSGGANVGFYADGSQTIPGFKAYLPATVGGSVKTFVFGDDATGISDLNDVKDSKNIIFNVAGQRMSKMQKGINIVNGKKVAMK